MNLRKVIVSILVILLSLGVEGLAESIDSLLIPHESCDHAWRIIQQTVTYDDEHVVNRALATRKLVVNMGDCHVIFHYMLHACDLCGIQQEMPIQEKQAHRYVVSEWEADKTDANLVHVAYICNACNQTRRERLNISAIQAADALSAEANCMRGGACPVIEPHHDVDLWWFVMENGKQYNAVQVTLMQDNQEVTVVAVRQHCPFCGRPQMLEIDAELSPEVLNDTPVFTYEEFMEYGTDPQAPYKLIDTLRNKAIET